MNKKRSVGHIKKLDDNKYLLRLSLGFDDFGKRIQPSKVVECTSDREAEKLLLEFYNQKETLLQNHNGYVPKTLGELYKYWLEYHAKKNLKEKTVEWYSLLWNKHIDDAKRVHLDILSPAHIHRIIDAANGERNKNAVYKMLKAILNRALKWGFVSSNPCTRIDAPHYKSKEKATLTEAELGNIVESIKQEELKYQALFYFAILCGMRRQEIVALKWSDIDFKNKQFRINRAASHIIGKGTVATTTKTEKSVRTLFLPEILEKLLHKLKTEQNESRFKYGNKWKNENWIFTQQDGHIMHIQTPSHWWSSFAKDNGIENVTFHGLRHTAATYMIKNNVPISTVSGVLGHSNITTTLNTYTHVVEDTKKIAIDVMSDILSSKDSDSSFRVV